MKQDKHPSKEAETVDLVQRQLLIDIRHLIESAWEQVSRAVNRGLVLLYWRLGRRIREEIIGSDRAEYGERIVSTLSRQLTADYGAGFSKQNLFHMLRFSEVWPDDEKVARLAARMGWSHFKELLYLADPLQRDFYAEVCRVEGWSVRALRERVRSMLYERTAISRKPEAVARQEIERLGQQDRMTPDLVFRDPYVLNFLGLRDEYSERDLEAAILSDLERFLLELGSDFAFVARQRRMTIGNSDYYLDLLFFHRGLRQLVAVDLKLGPFEAGYKGQMELYLRWLDKHERHHEHEASPVGLILCSEKDHEQVELLQLNKGEIRVAEYWTAMPERSILEARLHEAVRRARERLATHDP